MRHSWLRDIARRVFGTSRRHRGTIGRRKPSERQPAVEALEIRLVPATFTVTNTNDSGGGSFRQAIIDSNGSGPGLNTITFAILPAGVQTISLLSALPTVTHPVVIDGTTEPGFAGTPIIVLNGSGAGGGAAGLTITAGSSTVKGFVIDNFSGDGIDLTTNGGDLVQGNYIGINAAGTTAAANSAGILISTSASNTVGGATAATRNVISGNANDGIDIGTAGLNNVIEGNYIGTDAAGAVPVPNQGNGVFLTGTPSSQTIGNTIGGTGIGAGNVISGNKQSGLVLSGTDTSGNLVAGNLIGTNAAGTAALANKVNGVLLNGTGVGANTIGGLGAGNVISGNGGTGVNFSGTGNGNVLASNIIGADITGFTALGNGVDGVDLSLSNHNTIDGNVISGNSGIGVAMISSSGNVIAGNSIGTNAAGTAALGNTTGIILSGGSVNNTVGGTTAADANVISGNASDGLRIINAGATGNVVEGNFIGTNADGTAAVANTGNGVILDQGAAGNTIGGTSGGARNIISGNQGNGVDLSGTAFAPTNTNVIEGNYIGTDVTGTAPIPNASGVVIDGAQGNTIGVSATGGAGNVISGNTNEGVSLSTIGSSGNLIAGNLIGTDQTGTTALANGAYGVLINGGAVTDTVGGTTAAMRNVISGNAVGGVFITGTATTTNVVEGNYIGTNAAGTAALANGGIGVEVDTDHNTVGGTVAGAGNVISGNAGSGILLGGGAVLVAGNLIGTDATGSAALANALFGIDDGGANDTIGGTAAGARNVISGNTGDGVVLDGGSRRQQKFDPGQLHRHQPGRHGGPRQRALRGQPRLPEQHHRHQRNFGKRRQRHFSGERHGLRHPHHRQRGRHQRRRHVHHPERGVRDCCCQLQQQHHRRHDISRPQRHLREHGLWHQRHHPPGPADSGQRQPDRGELRRHRQTGQRRPAQRPRGRAPAMGHGQ